jgi:hypothetical protein
MRRYLVVANETLAGEPLVSWIRELSRAGPCAFFLIVPATPPRDHTWTEGEARATARARLDEALMRLSGLEIKVEGEVGDGNPMLAIDDAIRDHGRSRRSSCRPCRPAPRGGSGSTCRIAWPRASGSR